MSIIERGKSFPLKFFSPPPTVKIFGHFGGRRFSSEDKDNGEHENEEEIQRTVEIKRSPPFRGISSLARYGESSGNADM